MCRDRAKEAASLVPRPVCKVIEAISTTVTANMPQVTNAMAQIAHGNKAEQKPEGASAGQGPEEASW